MIKYATKQIILNNNFRNKGGQNAVTNSEDFGNAIWIKSALTVNAKSEIGPDRKLSADVIIEQATNANHQISQNTYAYTSGVTYTHSLFVKKGNRSNARDFIQFPNASAAFGTTRFANFDILNGVVASSTGVTAQVIKYKNGWFRLAMTSVATATSNTTKFPVFLIRNRTDGRVPVYLGDTNSDIIIFGAQLNVGQLLPYQQTFNLAI